MGSNDGPCGSPNRFGEEPFGLPHRQAICEFILRPAPARTDPLALSHVGEGASRWLRVCPVADKRNAVPVSPMAAAIFRGFYLTTGATDVDLYHSFGRLACDRIKYSRNGG